jgi:hypothetical protein
MNQVAVKTDPMTAFQEQLRERVRNDIRDLLPEDAVAGLVKQAVDAEFFKARRIDEGYGRWSEKPSWFVEEVVKAAKPIIEAAVQKTVADNPAVVEKAIKEYLDENRLTVAVASRLDAVLSSAIYNLQQTLQR